MAATTMVAPTAANANFFNFCLLRPDSISAERWYEERVFRAPVPFSSGAELNGNQAVYDGRAPKWRNW
jgi:hypothetical protein